jgi:hypothetical protein
VICNDIYVNGEITCDNGILSFGDITNFGIVQAILAGNSPAFEVNSALTRIGGYAGSYIDVFADINNNYMDFTPSGVNDFGVRLQCRKNGTATRSGQFFILASNFRIFRPVNQNNAAFSGNSLIRTLATNISFRGGLLVVLCNTSAFRNNVGIGSMTLRCRRSNNQELWSFQINQFFNARSFHLNFGTNTHIISNVASQNGAYLQLQRSDANLIQDFNDFTNVCIFELPL